MRGKKVSRLRLAMLLVSLLSAHVAFAFDGEATLKALRDSNKDTRRRALESPEVAGYYRPEPENCPTNPELFRQINLELIRLLKDPDPSIRRTAADYLRVSTDAQATKPLGRALRDSDDRVREIAASAFVHITVSAAEIVRDLETLLQDRSKAVRMNAAMALTYSGTRRSLAALRDAFNREADPGVKAIYGDALRDLEKRIR